MLTHYVFKTCIDVQILLSSAQRMSRVRESAELAGVRYDVHTGGGGITLNRRRSNEAEQCALLDFTQAARGISKCIWDVI